MRRELHGVRLASKCSSEFHCSAKINSLSRVPCTVRATPLR